MLKLLLIVLLAEFSFGGKLPDYIKTCHRKDPKLSACIRDSVENLRPHLIEGIPELNLPAIEPLKLSKIELFEDSPNIKASLADVVVNGLGQFAIDKLKLDVDKNTYRFGVTIPFVDIAGNYDVDAKILGSAIKTGGPFKANATKFNGQAVIQASINKDRRLHFDSMVMKIKMDDFNVDMENFFNQDPIIGQAAQQLLKGNKQDLIKLAAPFIESKCSKIILEMANEVCKDLDYDEIFPE